MIDRQTAVTALTGLSSELAPRGATGEVGIIRGTVMMLAFNAREATKDVDAVFEPAQIL